MIMKVSQNEQKEENGNVNILTKEIKSWKDFEYALHYFEKHKGSLIPVYLPTASPEFMILEECWNISKNDLLVLTYYTSFRDFRIKIGQYFRTKRFKFNMRKSLTGYGS